MDTISPKALEAASERALIQSLKYSYTLHGHTLNRVKSKKYLGLMITLDLNWNKHINNITARTNQSLGFVKRNVKTRPRLIKSLQGISAYTPRVLLHSMGPTVQMCYTAFGDGPEKSF